MEKIIGIVGVPPLKIIRQINEEQGRIIDLDEPQLPLPMNREAHLPQVYCAILRTVMLNAMNMALDRIYIDIGQGKCDCALHVATVLQHLLTIPVITTRNQDSKGFGFSICRSNLPLIEKLQAITQGVQSCDPSPDYQPSVPTAGFWGVPPRDFSLLSLFPDSTHVYGWTRCMENKTPADLELESSCNPAVPTVFFAQSFCAKTALAKHLAELHPKGLYVDCDVNAGSSARAKIEAFLELSQGTLTAPTVSTDNGSPGDDHAAG
ncbi:HAD family hydrolase [Candidatus Electrothrix aarhusensis]